MDFTQMGYVKAESEIQSHEEKHASSVYSEIKPFTTKAPTHVIESLDCLADAFSLSRNALVLGLLENYLGNAFLDYQQGYGSVLGETDEQFFLTRLEDLLKKSNLSNEAKSYLERSVLNSLGMPELIGDAK